MPLSIGIIPNRLQSTLALLSTAPAFLQPKSFWDICVRIRLLLLPCSFKLPVCPRSRWISQDSLAKTGATLIFTHFPSPLIPVIAKIRHIPVMMPGDEISLTNSLFCQISSVSSEELTKLLCHGHSLLLSSYLCKIKRKENSSCSACGHHLQFTSFWIIRI